VSSIRTVGSRPAPPAYARLRTTAWEYIVELEVPDFAKAELTVEAVGAVVFVRGDQAETEADEGKAFRLHERFEESFRLPDDADLDRIQVTYKHGMLVFRVPRIEVKPRRLPIERARSGWVLGTDAEDM
jgi:HSP20 family protein